MNSKLHVIFREQDTTPSLSTDVFSIQYPPNNQSLLTPEILHRYPPVSPGDAVASGVPLTGDVAVARGTNGAPGSGVYSVDLEGESSGAKVLELLAGLREKGVVEKFWSHTVEEFKRITGVEAV